MQFIQFSSFRSQPVQLSKCFLGTSEGYSEGWRASLHSGASLALSVSWDTGKWGPGGWGSELALCCFHHILLVKVSHRWSRFKGRGDPPPS